MIIGLWLLARDHLPAAIRPLLATIGAVLLVLYGVVAVTANVAARVGPLEEVMSGPRAALEREGGTRFVNATILNAPMRAGESLHITNPRGQTTITIVEGTEARVTATNHFWPRRVTPDVTLAPVSGGLRLTTPAASADEWRRDVGDLAVEVPSSVHLAVETQRGDVRLDGIAMDTLVTTTSGDVIVALSPRESARLTVTTSSGAIDPGPFAWSNRAQGDRRLTGMLGVGEHRLTIQTTTGDVQLRAEP